MQEQHLGSPLFLLLKHPFCFPLSLRTTYSVCVTSYFQHLKVSYEEPHFGRLLVLFLNTALLGFSILPIKYVVKSKLLGSKLNTYLSVFDFLCKY